MLNSRLSLWKKCAHHLMELGRLNLSSLVSFSYLLNLHFSLLVYLAISKPGSCLNGLYNLMTANKASDSISGESSRWLLNSQDFADFVHIGRWTGDRNSCHTLWQRQNYCVCFKSSRMCHELSILLYWKASFLSLSLMRNSIITFRFLFIFSSSLLYIQLFCRMGLRRHLTAAEIVDQAVFARRLLTSEVGSITNVVFMVGLQLH